MYAHPQWYANAATKHSIIQYVVNWSKQPSWLNIIGSCWVQFSQIFTAKSGTHSVLSVLHLHTFNPNREVRRWQACPILSICLGCRCKEKTEGRADTRWNAAHLYVETIHRKHRHEIQHPYIHISYLYQTTTKRQKGEVGQSQTTNYFTTKPNWL